MKNIRVLAPLPATSSETITPNISKVTQPARTDIGLHQSRSQKHICDLEMIEMMEKLESWTEEEHESVPEVVKECINWMKRRQFGKDTSQKQNKEHTNANYQSLSHALKDPGNSGISKLSVLMLPSGKRGLDQHGDAEIFGMSKSCHFSKKTAGFPSKLRVLKKLDACQPAIHHPVQEYVEPQQLKKIEPSSVISSLKKKLQNKDLELSDLNTKVKQLLQAIAQKEKNQKNKHQKQQDQSKLKQRQLQKTKYQQKITYFQLNKQRMQNQLKKAQQSNLCLRDQLSQLKSKTQQSTKNEKEVNQLKIQVDALKSQLKQREGEIVSLWMMLAQQKQ